MTNNLGGEIRELNLSYLLLAQQMIRVDREGAMLKLGVADDVADLLENLSPAQVLRMASADMLLCRFRFDDELLIRVLTSHERGDSVGRVHAAILAASKPVESLN